MTSARRLLLRAGLVLVALVLLDAGWLAVRVLATRGHLLAAQHRVTAARDQLRAGHVEGALANASLAALDTRSARGIDDDPVWWLDSHLPLIGPSLRAVSGLSDAADGLATDVVPALAHVADDVRGDHLRLPDVAGTGGGIDLSRLADATPRVNAAAAALAGTRARVQAIGTSGLLGPVAGARATLLAQLDDLTGQLAGARKALRLAPTMLGADGPRLYFLNLENSAEARGAGGLLGEYGILAVDHGRIELIRSGSNEDLQDAATPSVNLGAAFSQQWGDFGPTQTWRTTTVSPNYPDSAAAIVALWKRQTGQQLDGVISIDPTAAGYLLAAGAPFTLPDGSTVAASDFASFVESGLYVRYRDNTQRKAVLQEVEHDVFASLLKGGADPGGLLTGLGRAAGEGRLLIDSTHPAEEAQLATMAAGGVFPDTPGPFSGLIVNNASADKLDFYLDRTLDFTAAPCAPDGSRRTTTTVTLTNTAPDPATLPGYVVGRNVPQHTEPVGTLKEFVTLYGGVGAHLVSVTLDGQPAITVAGVERGHTLANLYLTLASQGGTHRLTVVWDEKPGPVQAPYLQPLVRDPAVTVDAPACRT